MLYLLHNSLNLVATIGAITANDSMLDYKTANYVFLQEFLDSHLCGKGEWLSLYPFSEVVCGYNKHGGFPNSYL